MTEDQVVYLTKDEIKNLSEDIAEHVVARVFRDLGVSAGPDASLEEAKAVRADFQFLRDWRELCEMNKRWGAKAFISMVLTGGFVVLALGVKAWLSQ